MGLNKAQIHSIGSMALESSNKYEYAQRQDAARRSWQAFRWDHQKILRRLNPICFCPRQNTNGCNIKKKVGQPPLHVMRE